jgi:ABC-2 type transport system permease protein
VLRASLYIIVHSTKNRLLVRLRRLREPRYLIGAVAGAAYFYFAVFVRINAARTRRGRAPVSPFDVLSSYGGTAGYAGLLLLVVAILAWLVPADSALLAFSEAETDLLVPAPVTRRELLIHRLLRSQLPLLFGALVSSLFVPAAIAQRLRFAVGIFVLLVTGRIYFTGVTMARYRFAGANGVERRAAWAPFVLLFGIVLVVGDAIVRVFRSMPAAPWTDVLRSIGETLRTGPAAMALLPFTTLAQPLLARSSSELLLRLAGAVGVMVLAVAWVLQTDQALQPDPEIAQRPPSSGRHAARLPRLRSVGWTLALVGRTETVFLWKNAMQSFRASNALAIVPFVVPATLMAVIGATTGMTASAANRAAAALATACLMFAAFCALLGPQTVRTDLRGDLRHLDVLKTWPVKAAAVIRGELLWPAVSLTACVWFAVVCAAVFSVAAFPALTWTMRLSLAAAAVVLAPALVTAQLTVHNAAVVFFPAWISIGPQRFRGLDAMGQRLILFAGVLLALVVMLGPGVIAGGLVAFAFYRLAGPISLVPAAAVCLAIVIVEIAFVTEMLGSAYDRLDLAQIERAE